MKLLLSLDKLGRVDWLGQMWARFFFIHLFIYLHTTNHLEEFEPKFSIMKKKKGNSAESHTSCEQNAY